MSPGPNVKIRALAWADIALAHDPAPKSNITNVTPAMRALPIVLEDPIDLLFIDFHSTFGAHNIVFKPTAD